MDPPVSHRMWSKSWIHKHIGWYVWTSGGVSIRPPTFRSLCTSAGAGHFCCKMALMFLFSNKEMDMQFMKNIGPICSKVRCNVQLWYVLATVFQLGSWCWWCLHCRGGYTVLFHLRCETSRFSLEHRWCAGREHHLPHILMCVFLWQTVHAMKLFGALLHMWWTKKGTRVKYAWTNMVVYNLM